MPKPLQWRRTSRSGDEVQLALPYCTITIHRHVDEPVYWFLSCRALDIQRYRLDAATLEAAQREALVRLREVVRGLAADLSRALDSSLAGTDKEEGS